MKFSLDIIFQTESYLIIQSYLFGGANSKKMGESGLDACQYL